MASWRAVTSADGNMHTRPGPEPSVSVELLIGTPGVDINAKDRDQRTPLLIAAEVGRQSIVKMLLDASDLTRFRAGAAKLDVDWADSDGDTALAGAAREGHSEVVRLLLTQGNCDPQHRD